MSSFDISPFFKNLPTWIEKFRTGPKAGDFSFSLTYPKSALYGAADHVVTMWTTGLLDDFLNTHEKSEWIERIQSFQNSTSGWIMDPHHQMGHFRQHSTAFSLAALDLLGAQPLYPLKFVDKYKSKAALERALRHFWLWAPRLEWVGSHIGSGIAASILMTRTPMPDGWWTWFFTWLDTHTDPGSGLWKYGLLHHKGQGNFWDLGAAFHYYFLYPRCGRSFQYPEKMVDSALQMQQRNGLWFRDIPYCPDLDGIYTMVRASEQIQEYREADIRSAIEKYLDYVVPRINDRMYLFQTYKETHKMTGLVATLAEIQRKYPEILQSPRPLRQILDTSLYI